MSFAYLLVFLSLNILIYVQAQNICTCDNGVPAEGDDCDVDNTNQCTSCTTNGYWLREILVPAHMFGQTLSELDIRKQTGVQILLIRSRGVPGGERKAVHVPGPMDRLEEGQTLIVAGSRDGLDKIDRSRN